MKVTSLEAPAVTLYRQSRTSRLTGADRDPTSTQIWLRGDRFARHWHDVVRLDEAGLANAALADRELANAVARHKAMFFAEKAADRSPIDYALAVNGGLQLAPGGEASKALEEDYGRMVEDGLLLEDAEPFEVLMARCADIAARANRAAG